MNPWISHITISQTMIQKNIYKDGPSPILQVLVLQTPLVSNLCEGAAGFHHSRLNGHILF